jgi:hypothetical protein
MKLEARDGLEFEFTCVLDVIHDGHYATVSKDRTGLFAGDPKPITVETGRRLAEWLAGGHAVEVTAVDDQAVVAKARDAISEAATVDRLDKVMKAVAQRVTEKRITETTAASLCDEAAQKRTELNTTTAVTA